MSTRLQSQMDLLLTQAFKEKALDKKYGACQIKVVCHGEQVFKKRYGRKYKFFDLASVTKAVCTTPIIIQLVQEKKIKPEDKVKAYLGRFIGHPIGDLTIASLLNQTSGLPYWRPFYKKKDGIVSQLLKEVPGDRSKAVYSDLNFILLGLIIEKIEGHTLDRVFKNRIANPLKLKKTFFIKGAVHKAAAHHKKEFAPTEKNFRGVIQGVVHDENAWSFGGVSGHTGLFSTIDEASRLAEELLKAYNGKSKLFRKNLFRKFTERAIRKAKGDWGLGFMIPSKPLSTGGALISTESFGFPGFVGTSVWIDTKRNAAVTILANRTFPSRKNEKFKKTRQEIHDVIWRAL